MVGQWVRLHRRQRELLHDPDGAVRIRQDSADPVPIHRTEHHSQLRLQPQLRLRFQSRICIRP